MEYNSGDPHLLEKRVFTLRQTCERQQTAIEQLNGTVDALASMVSGLAATVRLLRDDVDSMSWSSGRAMETRTATAAANPASETPIEAKQCNASGRQDGTTPQG